MIGSGALAEEAREGFGARHADARGGPVEAERVGGCGVAARDAHGIVVDDDAIGDRINGLLPDFFRRADGLKQTRIVERKCGHLGQACERLSFFSIEMMRGAEADDEQTQHLTAHAQRRKRHIAHALGAVQRKLCGGQIITRADTFEHQQLIRVGRALSYRAAQWHGKFLLGNLCVRAKTARRLPSDRLFGARETGDGRRVRAHDAAHSLDDRAQGRGAFGCGARVIAARRLRCCACAVRSHRTLLRALRCSRFSLHRGRGRGLARTRHPAGHKAMARGTSIFYASGRQSVKRKAETQARANALMIICSRRDLPTSNGVMRRRAIM